MQVDPQLPDLAYTEKAVRAAGYNLNFTLGFLPGQVGGKS
jgi:hypothetical protein